MDISDWEPAGLAREKARRKIRRKNDAFRQRLQQQQEAQRRETAKLRLASCAAAAAWLCVAVECLR